MDANRITSRAALVLSGAALVMSAWAVGCRDGSTTPAAEELEPPARPAAEVAAPEKANPKTRGDDSTKSKRASEPPAVEARANQAEVETSAPPVDPAEPDLEELELRRLVVTRAIEKREPAPGDDFRTDGEPIYAFVELANPTSAPAEIVVTFEHTGGTEVGHVKLEIPAKQSRWRTWGRTRNIKKAGAWTAIVKTTDGDEIGRAAFEVRG